MEQQNQIIPPLTPEEIERLRKAALEASRKVQESSLPKTLETVLEKNGENKINQSSENKATEPIDNSEQDEIIVEKASDETIPISDVIGTQVDDISETQEETHQEEVVDTIPEEVQINTEPQGINHNSEEININANNTENTQTVEHTETDEVNLESRNIDSPYKQQEDLILDEEISGLKQLNENRELPPVIENNNLVSDNIEAKDQNLNPLEKNNKPFSEPASEESVIPEVNLESIIAQEEKHVSSLSNTDSVPINVVSSSSLNRNETPTGIHDFPNDNSIEQRQYGISSQEMTADSINIPVKSEKQLPTNISEKNLSASIEPPRKINPEIKSVINPFERAENQGSYASSSASNIRPEAPLPPIPKEEEEKDNKPNASTGIFESVLGIVLLALVLAAVFVIIFFSFLTTPKEGTIFYNIREAVSSLF